MLFKNRKYQLPLWLELFTIIFLISGFLVPIIVIIALLGIKPELEIYGIESSNPLSSVGLILLGIFLLKGVVAMGIYQERKWAFQLAKIDAFIGIIICIVQFGFMTL